MAFYFHTARSRVRVLYISLQIDCLEAWAKRGSKAIAIVLND